MLKSLILCYVGTMQLKSSNLCEQNNFQVITFATIARLNKTL